MKLYFIRHAESQKNAQDRHGGKGLPITEQGKADTIELISFLESVEEFDFNNSLFFCSDRVQVLDMAKLIEDRKQVFFQVEDALKNISLGVLDGLSNDEAYLKYPQEAENIAKWRNGLIKIDAFTIPDAETMEQFYNRIYQFISSITKQDKDVVVIGTRSVGVAIANIFRNYFDKIDMDNYDRYIFDPCSMSKFIQQDGNYGMVYINNTEFLSNKPQYPDK